MILGPTPPNVISCYHLVFTTCLRTGPSDLAATLPPASRTDWVLNICTLPNEPVWPEIRPSILFSFLTVTR